MFGFQTKKDKKIIKQQEELAALTKEVEYRTRINIEDEVTIKTFYEENLKLKKEIEELKKLSVISDKNSVTLEISDDILSVKPVIKYSPDVFEKLFELGYLDDSKNNPQAIQLALLMVANEALSQILEAFSENIE